MAETSPQILVDGQDGLANDKDLNFNMESEQTILIAIGPENDIIGEVELDKQIIEIGPEQLNGNIEMIAPYSNFEGQTIELRGIDGSGNSINSNIEMQIANQLIELTGQTNTLMEQGTPSNDSQPQNKQKEYITENDHSILPLLPLLQDFMGNLDQQTINKLGMNSSGNNEETNINTRVEIQNQAIEKENERDDYTVEMVPPRSGKKLIIKRRGRGRPRKSEVSTSITKTSKHLYKSQNEIKSFQCTQCDQTFSCKRSLANHKSVHNEEKPFPCNYCEKSFVYKKVLAQHQKKHNRKENNGRPYQCNVCKEYFTQKKNLKMHQKQHDTENLFHCKHCDMHFTHKTKWMTHEKSHRGKPLYQCRICRKYFSAKQSLEKHHKVVHTHMQKSFKCNNCESSFSKSTDLVNHLKEHLTGAKPYQCSHCELSFVMKGTLLEHLKIHTGVTQYHCSQCELCFFNKWALVMHQKTHNG